MDHLDNVQRTLRRGLSTEADESWLNESSSQLVDSLVAWTGEVRREKEDNDRS
jgi:hypothetical protein